MSNHTPEPWRVGRPGTVVSDTPVPGMGGSDAVDYYGGHLIGESIVESNARRIVACVNACAGLSTDELDRFGLGSAFGSELLEVKKQRYDLLAAANAAMAWWEEHQYDCDGERNRYDDEPEFVTLSREAIAKAKGGAA